MVSFSAHCINTFFYANNNRNLIFLYNDSSKNLRHVSTLIFRVIDQYYHHENDYHAMLFEFVNKM